MKKLTKEEKATLQYYDTYPEEWRKARRVGSESLWESEVAKLNQLLPTGKILEIGSGSGREAALLVRYGYDYVGTDASSGLLKIAQKDNPTAIFLKQSVYDLDFPEETFDGFWTAATLLHIPKKRILEALARISRVVKPEGIGFISLKEGQGKEIEESTGRLFSYYSLAEFKEVLKQTPFSVINASKKVRPGRDTTWLSFFVRNSK